MPKIKDNNCPAPRTNTERDTKGLTNFPEILLNYRIHEDQVTFNGGKGGAEKWNNIRNKMIDDMVNT